MFGITKKSVTDDTIRNMQNFDAYFGVCPSGSSASPQPRNDWSILIKFGILDFKTILF